MSSQLTFCIIGPYLWVEELQYPNSYSYWTVQCYNPEYLPEHSDRSDEPPGRLFSGCRDSLLSSKRPGVKLTTHLYLMQRLRMSEAIILSLPICLHGVDITRNFTFINHERAMARSGMRSSGCLRPGTKEKILDRFFFNLVREISTKARWISDFKCINHFTYGHKCTLFCTS